MLKMPLLSVWLHGEDETQIFTDCFRSFFNLALLSGSTVEYFYGLGIRA